MGFSAEWRRRRAVPWRVVFHGEDYQLPRGGEGELTIALITHKPLISHRKRKGALPGR